MSVVVIVPVRDQPRLTARFLDCMREQEFDDLLVLDNGSKAPTVKVIRAAAKADDRIYHAKLPGLSIYELWNRGFETAEHDPPEDDLSVLVCNNDIVLPAGAVAVLEEQLRAREELLAVYPDYDWPWSAGLSPKGVRVGRGVMRDGGLYGPCFLVAADRIPWRPLVSDTAYEWWYGDNHLARDLEENGKHARVVGVPVLHDNEGTAKHHPELDAAKHRDRQRWMISQRRRRPGSMHMRRVVPGTRVWTPGGARRSDT